MIIDSCDSKTRIETSANHAIPLSARLSEPSMDGSTLVFSCVNNTAFTLSRAACCDFGNLSSLPFLFLVGSCAPQAPGEICSSFVVFNRRLMTFESTQPLIKLGRSNMLINLGVHKSAVAVIVLLLLCQLPAISAFRPSRNVDFAYCWNSTVQYLNTTNYDDKRQYFHGTGRTHTG